MREKAKYSWGRMSFDVLYSFLNNHSLRFLIYIYIFLFSFLFEESRKRDYKQCFAVIPLASCVRITLPLAEFHDELRGLRCLARLDEILLLRWLLEGLLMSS